MKAKIHRRRILTLFVGAASCAALALLACGDPYAEAPASSPPSADAQPEVIPNADGGNLNGDGPSNVPPPVLPDASACSSTMPFDRVVRIDSLSEVGSESWPRLSQDELEIVFNRGEGSQTPKLFHAKRSSVDEPFEDVVQLAEEATPGTLTADGLQLFFVANQDIYGVARATRTTTFSATPVNVASINSSFGDYLPYAVLNELWFMSTREASLSVFHAVRLDAGQFSTPRRVPLLNDNVWLEGFAVTEDLLTLYVGLPRIPDGGGSIDISVATRTNADEPFGAFKRVDALNTDGDEYPGWVSPDNCRLYFASDRPGTTGRDLFVASKSR